MLECIADERSRHLNSHVRVIYTEEEDKRTVTSPAKVAARRVDTVPSSSDEEDTVKKRRNRLFEGDNSKHRKTKRRRGEKKGIRKQQVSLMMKRTRLRPIIRFVKTLLGKASLTRRNQ